MIIVCRIIVKPLTFCSEGRQNEFPNLLLPHLLLHRKKRALVLHTTVLIAMVAGSSYAGTSNLFVAYLAGASIHWWETEVSRPQKGTKKSISIAACDLNKHQSRVEGLNKATADNVPGGQDVRISEEGQRNKSSRQL